MDSYSINDIKHYNNKEKCLIIINNNVYNITNYIKFHPGGADILLENSGKDATIEFNNIGHSINAEIILKKYKIGYVYDNIKEIVNISYKSILGKFFTHEDKFYNIKHIHKTLGILCLIHYIYRFSVCIYDQYMYNNYDARFNNSYISLFLLLIHGFYLVVV